MKNQNKNQPYYVPKSIQKLFVLSIGSLYLLQTAIVAYSTATQAIDGSDYRPQLGYLFSYMLLPIIAFVLAYLINPRKISMLSKAFESLLITVAGYIAWSILLLLLPVFFLSVFFSYDYTVTNYVFPLVFLFIFAISLVILRKRGTWA